MENFLTQFFKNNIQQYWIEVKTTKPNCTYYFGPYLTRKEANLAQSGFLEDLKTENAENIMAEIKRCQPEELTIFDQVNDKSDAVFV